MAFPPTLPSLTNGYFGQMTLSFGEANAGFPPQALGFVSMLQIPSVHPAMLWDPSGELVAEVETNTLYAHGRR
jgi:hypothetical protein